MKNTLEGINSMLGKTEDSISDLEDKVEKTSITTATRTKNQNKQTNKQK